MPQGYTERDELCVKTIRMLSADMVEAANSGHPGMPLGAAPMAYVLFSRFLRFNPVNPDWPGRDRFVLSAGHGSALLYSLLHLFGYDLTLDDIRAFRQWGSKTPGHPESGLTPGVEVTSGPLGQGFAMAVGMAMAQRWLAGRYNRPGLPVMDHHVYCLAGDGDLMEGVSCEAASLAGTLGLGRLIVLYDDNHITIEGDTDLAFTEDVAARFKSYHWQVLEVADGEDLKAVEEALNQARADSERPTLIKVRTHIGYGSPKIDTAGVHGSPLGVEALAETRKYFCWPEEAFCIPDETAAHCGGAQERGRKLETEWKELLANYSAKYPAEAAELKRALSGELPAGWEEALPRFSPDQGNLATRKASGQVINALAPIIPELMGGSADLAPSNNTVIKGSGDMRGRGADCGRNIHFGVREFGMAAAVNGMALHGGVIPYGATFFVFTDYARPALRLAALQEIRSIMVLTHDSVGLGEDGPTHQPVEHLMSLRAMPGYTLVRPADANETAVAWKLALTRADGPTGIILSRQGLPILDPAKYPVHLAEKGGYVLADSEGEPQVILIATGAEVHLALAAREELAGQGVAARVVSLPSWEVFAAQDQAYIDSVLPPAVSARVSIEAGTTLGWERWVGCAGAMIGVDRFGASAPGKVVLEKLGLSVANVVAQAKEVLAG